jgi:hypothetical protein
MSIIKRMRKQKAVWWKRSTTANRFGKFSFDDPVEISCRWDDKQYEDVDSRGQTTRPMAVVYPDRVLNLGDKLKKGEMDSDTPDDPTTDRDAFEISKFSETPNLRNTEVLYTAELMR